MCQTKTLRHQISPITCVRRSYEYLPGKQGQGHKSGSPQSMIFGTILWAATVKNRAARIVDAAVITAYRYLVVQKARSSIYRRPISFLDRV
jgi:hypothetical protein